VVAGTKTRPQINGTAAGWSTGLSKITALVDPGTGTLTTSDTSKVQSINMQASVLANCVNSSGGVANDSTACGQLLSNPNASFSLLSTVTVTGYYTYGLAVSPDGGSLYVTNQSIGGVSTLQSDHGALTWISDYALVANTPENYVLANSNPTGIAVSPDGQYVVANNSYAYFTLFQTSSAGLTPVNGTASDSTFTPTTGGNFQNSLFSKDGRQLFIANTANAAVTSYTMSNGLPDFSTENSTPAGNSPWALALSPDGQYLYVSDSLDNTITVYDTSSGALTPINGTLGASTFAAGATPFALAVSPDGKYVYAVNKPVSTGASATVTVFASLAGQLSALSSTLSAGITSGPWTSHTMATTWQ
jgi:DNA-binding beta-propeller fold protein YncE